MSSSSETITLQAARRASLAFLVSGLLVIPALLVPGQATTRLWAYLGIGALDLLAALLLRVIPFHRWSRWVLLACVLPVALMVIGLSTVNGLVAPQVYASFYGLLFLWIGVAFPVWTSLWLSPVISAAYVTPLIVQGQGAEAIVPGMISLAVWIAAGELLARVLRRLETSRRDTESALAQSRDRALEVARQKSDFLSTMSHEIRTPLNAVIGFSSLLLETRLDSEQRSYANGLRKGGEGLLSLVNDILDFSKIDAGKLDLERAPFDLAGCVRDAVELTQEAFAARKVLLRAELADGLPKLVLGDPARLRQVILNLLGNAAKFSRRGEAWIRVRPEGPRVRFEVEDTGPGIAEEHRALLFKHFSQLPSETVKQGTGLGLAISDRLVTAMGGAIGVESTHGRGSTFWFELPLERAELTPATPAPVLSREPKTPNGRRVLIAEDNRTNQVVALRMVEAMGFQVDLVGNGSEAVRALAQRRYDAVLMDCAMPVMDGFEATEQIRKQEQPGPRTRIIALTASATDEQREKCLAVGMDAFLTKPLRKDALFAALQA